ncbi:MAG: prolipoprotein diacylglyceryl transferase [Actinomycetota bacterium]
MLALLAAIPSPGDGAIEIGPLTFRAYGFMIALGVLAAVWLVGRRFGQRGMSPDHATGLAMWAVPAGLVGARLYHVITDWRSFEGRWGEAFKIWEGGLGILGGVIAGAVAGYAYMKRHGIEPGLGFDVAAPALPLAQAIGRWGNWFNQELFGRPTDLPWALEIDVDHRPAEYIDEETFHPTFLYESLWNILLVVALLRLDAAKRLRPWGLFFTYLAGYSVGRLWIEAIRIDTASEIAGLRVNLWVFGLLLIASATMVARHVRRDTTDVDVFDDLADAEAGDDVEELADAVAGVRDEVEGEQAEGE